MIYQVLSIDPSDGKTLLIDPPAEMEQLRQLTTRLARTALTVAAGDVVDTGAAGDVAEVLVTKTNPVPISRCAVAF